jgi:hypothetical protein
MAVVDSTKNDVELEDPAPFWNYASDTTQYKLISKFIKIGNGAVRLPPDKISLIAGLINIKTCADSNSDSLFEYFNKDLEVFNVIRDCVNREGWL